MNRYPNPQHNRVNERLRRRRRRAWVLTIFFFVIILLTLLSVYVGLLIRSRMTDNTPDGSDSTPAVTTDAIETPPPVSTTSAPETEPPAPAVTYKTLSLTHADMVTGDLILVNAEFPYTFPANEKHIKTVYGNKSTSYKVRDTIVSLDTEVLSILNTAIDAFYAATGDHNLLFNSGYRSFDFQKNLYDTRVASEGAVEAAKYVALPGNSEHHTGLAFDLTVYTDEGKSYALDSAEVYNWVPENFPGYGFVLRYPASKIAVTGIAYEPWHFRYVGIPHAVYMTAQGLCLEEYINALRAYPFDGTHLTVEANGTEYEIYYVPASLESETTEVKVPEGANYTVSGNNVDGFIVTLTR